MARSRARRALFFSQIKPHFDQLRLALQEVVCMDRSTTATAGSFLNLAQKIATQKLRRSDTGAQTTRIFPLTRSSRFARRYMYRYTPRYIAIHQYIQIKLVYCRKRAYIGPCRAVQYIAIYISIYIYRYIYLYLSGTSLLQTPVLSP